MTLAEAAAQADALADAGDEQRARRRCARAVGRRASRRRRAPPTTASAPSPTARSAQFRFRQKIELLRRGLEDESPACRGSALLSLELLSRDHPGVVNAVRPLLHELVANDGNEAVRRLAIVALRNGSPQRDTIAILDRARRATTSRSRELREAAAKVAQVAAAARAGPAR